MGCEGIAQVSRDAILNANYLRHLIKTEWPAEYPGAVCHEFVISAKHFKQNGVKALDVAKRLIDLGYHPPTIYFPLIVPEALMIEPTETESKETIEAFATSMNRIALEARTQPDILTSAPQNTPVRRLDEAKAAKELKVKAL
jgi:glycine dehydrogenase subunit 2